jgi:hypothetical protein
MKKLPFAFLAFFALSLCSFAIYENYQENPPIEESARKQYLSLFRTEKLPYRIDEKSNAWEAAPRLTRDQRHFIPDLARGGFSRMGPSTYRPDAIIVSNDVFDAVIYTVREPRGSSMPDFVLQTINKKGDIISEETIYIGYYEESGETFATINADLSINMKTMHYDYKEKRNTLVNQTWTIGEDGKINMMPAAKDSHPKQAKNG